LENSTPVATFGTGEDRIEIRRIEAGGDERARDTEAAGTDERARQTEAAGDVDRIRDAKAAGGDR